MYNHAGERYPSHQTAAMVEDMMPGMLRMMFQEWDPGEMNTYSEMYLPEVSMAKEVIRGHVMEWDPGETNSDSEMYLHGVSMAKEVIRGHVITGIVMKWDPGGEKL